MLDYSISKIDEYIDKIRNDIENEPDYVEKKINLILQKYQESTDIIEKYNTLMKAYMTFAENEILINKDIVKFKGYSYLAVKAGEVCFDLAEKGYKTYMSALNENLRTKRNIFYYVRYAIFANRWDIAQKLTPKDTLLGAVLEKDYERSKKYLPESFNDIQKSEDMEQMLWAIVYKDEKRMNKLLENSIKELRRMAKKFPAVCFDSGDLGFIKIAKERGMNIDINVIELPINLLDNEPIDENDWKLPQEM